MTTIDSGGVNTSADIFSQISARKGASANKNEEDKNDFLKLMIAQLKNQNPLNPQDGGAFLSQLAQFSTVEGIQNMQSSISGLAATLQSNQALQATSMVGRTVLVKGSTGELPPGGYLVGSVDLPSSTANLGVNIYSQAGVLLKQYNLGSQAAGTLNFSWDGMDEIGNRLPPGMYKAEVIGEYNGKAQQLPVYMGANVNSVTLNQAGGVMLNVAGVGAVALTDVKQIF